MIGITYTNGDRFADETFRSQMRNLIIDQDVTDRRVEAALVVIVAEAEPLVGRFRAKHDPAASWGMPAHITINYPFIPGVSPSADTVSRLSKMFNATKPFSFTLDHVGRFPDVVYLAPVPSAPLVNLIEQTAHEFPESPPYGGQFESIKPHLTVAQSRISDLLVSVEQEFSDAASDKLPLHIFTDRLWLMDNREGRWEKRVSFSLRAI